MHDGNRSAMGGLQQLTNLPEQSRRHFPDEKKLPFAFLAKSFGQQFLDEDANLASSRLLILEFINHQRLKTVSADLKQFTDPAPIGEGEGGQGGSIQHATIEALRLKQHLSWAPGKEEPLRIASGWRE